MWPFSRNTSNEAVVENPACIESEATKEKEFYQDDLPKSITKNNKAMKSIKKSNECSKTMYDKMDGDIAKLQKIRESIE